jgi:hypothetical protein
MRANDQTLATTDDGGKTEETEETHQMTRSEKFDWILLAFAVVFFALTLFYSIAERPVLGLFHGPACICDECYDRMDAERGKDLAP